MASLRSVATTAFSASLAIGASGPLDAQKGPPLPKLETTRFGTVEQTRDRLKQIAEGNAELFSPLTPGPGSRFPSAQNVLQDLKQLVVPWLRSSGLEPDRARRAMAAYGLDVASLVMSNDMRGGPELLSWVRGRLIQPHTPPNAFDRLWHAIVIAVFENLGAADAAQGAAESALKQFPGDPRFVLALAWAEEQRLSVDLTAGRALPDNKLHRVRSRLTDAMVFPDVRGEALLRFGRVELATRRYDAALRHLDDAEPLLTEPGLRYLRQLFRGRALASLGRAADGEAAYDAALAVVPGAQSATMAKSELLFLLGDRGRAEAAVDELLRRVPAVDPWWIYPRGDARFAATLIASLRGELR